jgi:hypothetical protein
MKLQIEFKDPDAIYDIINAKHPRPDDEGDDTPNKQQAREDFSEQYFEYGDYGRLEIDTDTMTARLLPRSEWKK